MKHETDALFRLDSGRQFDVQSADSKRDFPWLPEEAPVPNRLQIDETGVARETLFVCTMRVSPTIVIALAFTPRCREGDSDRTRTPLDLDW